jgi:lysophospholipase L1-like esterase
VTTVGSVAAGPATAPASWKSHEGHPGWRIDQIEAIAPAWAKLGATVITYLLGANDCLQGDGAEVAIQRMAQLINTTQAVAPGATVFVASMLDVPAKNLGGRAKECQVGLNSALPRLLAAANAANPTRSPVQFVYVPVAENTAGVCGNDTTTWSIGDGVHPNPAGHMRVGSVFANYILNTICPSHHAC